MARSSSACRSSMATLSRCRCAAHSAWNHSTGGGTVALLAPVAEGQRVQRRRVVRIALRARLELLQGDGEFDPLRSEGHDGGQGREEQPRRAAKHVTCNRFSHHRSIFTSASTLFNSLNLRSFGSAGRTGLTYSPWAPRTWIRKCANRLLPRSADTSTNIRNSGGTCS